MTGGTLQFGQNTGTGLGTMNTSNIGQVSSVSNMVEEGGGGIDLSGLGSGLTKPSMSSGLGAASSVLSDLPAIIANAKMDASEIGQTREEVKNLVKAQNMNFITQGISTGGTIGSMFGPIGSLIGSAVGGLGGFIAGKTQEGRALNEFNQDENEEVNEEWADLETKRLQEYYDTNTSQQMEAELRLTKQQNGFIS